MLVANILRFTYRWKNLNCRKYILVSLGLSSYNYVLVLRERIVQTKKICLETGHSDKTTFPQWYCRE